MADLGKLESGDRGRRPDGRGRITTEATAEGADPQAILDVMTAAMEVIGHRFACNEIYIPEMPHQRPGDEGAMAILEPTLTASGIQPEHTAVIGTII
ncbi:MAG: B12-binding domain-containing protein [Acidimicrobiia bacterium]|nr:B12-binding domain-containing protein [Acidimicrobiia bacterium]